MSAGIRTAERSLKKTALLIAVLAACFIIRPVTALADEIPPEVQAAQALQQQLDMAAQQQAALAAQQVQQQQALAALAAQQAQQQQEALAALAAQQQQALAALAAQQEAAQKAAQKAAEEAQARQTALAAQEASMRASETGMTYIDVSLDNQILTYFVNGSPVITTPCVTGGPKNSTPRGVFAINSMVPGKYLTGPTWHVWVNRWMRFYGSCGIHDASWRRKFGGNIYRSNGSHGCVNIPPSVANQLYSMVGLGTVVIVH